MKRKIFFAISFCILVVLLDPARLHGQQPTVLQGTLGIVWGDPHPQRGSGGRTVHTLTLADGTRVPLDMSTQRSSTSQFFGRQVAVTGRVVGNAILVDSISRNQPTDSLSAPAAAFGTKKVIYLLLKFADDVNVPHPPVFYSDLNNPDAPPVSEVFPTTVNGFFKRTSWNQLSWLGDVGGVGGVGASGGWLTLPQPKSYYAPCGWTGTCANLGAIGTDGLALGRAQGINFANYDNINFVLSNDLDCCAWGGSYYSSVENKTFGATWEPPWGQETGVYVHEMGHSLGLQHSGWVYYAYDSPWDVMSFSFQSAQSVLCGTYLSKNSGAVNSVACTEPGDGYIAPHKDYLGWIPSANEVITDTSSRLTVTLEANSLDLGSYPKMIKICITGVPCTGSSAHYLTVEARVKGLGPTSQYDNGIPGGGIIIHDFQADRAPISGPCYLNNQSGWAVPIDATPGDYDSVACGPGARNYPNYALNNAEWLLGQTYTNAAYGLTIKVTGTNQNGSLWVVAINPETVVATPTFNPGGGTYISAQTVIISSTTSGATICYTTDGSSPAANTPGTCSSGSSLANGGTVTVSASVTLKAIATKSGLTNSAVGSASYTIGVAPVFTSANNTTLRVGAPGSFTVTATGTPTPSLSETGTLPSGVTFKDNGNGTATLGGTPGAGTGGTYALTFTASNGAGTPANQSFTLTVSTCVQNLAIGNFTLCGEAYNDVTGANVRVNYSPSPNNGIIAWATWCFNSACNSSISGVTATIGDNINATESCFVASPHSPFITNANGGGQGSGDFQQHYVWYCPSIPAGVTSFTMTPSNPNLSYLQLNISEWKAGSLAASCSPISACFENVDNLGQAGNSIGGTTATITTSGPTVNANDLIFAVTEVPCCSFTARPGTGYTGITVAPSVTPGMVSEAKAATTAGIQTATTTWSGGSTPWFGVIVPIIGAGADPVAATPTFNPGGGTYTSSQIVTISSTTSGATICYTTDGSSPAANTPGTCSSGSSLANGGTVTVSASVTLKAIATKSGLTNSAVGSASYTIAVVPVFTSANNTTFTLGALGSFTVTATGTPTPSLSETGTLPTGVIFKDNGNGTATLGGTPGAGTGGTYGLTFTASNGAGTPANQSFTLTVSTCVQNLAIGNFTLCGEAYNNVSTGANVKINYSPSPNNAIIAWATWCFNSACNSSISGVTATIGDNINATESCFVASPHSPFITNANGGAQGSGDFQQHYVWYCPSIRAGVTSFTMTPSNSNLSYLQLSISEWKAGSLAASCSPISACFENVDNLGQAGDSTGSTTATITTSGPTINANDLIFAVTEVACCSFTASPGTGYTGITVAPSVTPGMVSEAKAATSTGIQIATTTWVGDNPNFPPLAPWFGVIVPIIGAGAAPVAATPTFSPGTGTYTFAQTVIISSSTSGATICYTTDGNNPAANTPGTCSSGTALANGGTVTVSASVTLKAIATESGFTNSGIGSASYTIGAPSATCHFTLNKTDFVTGDSIVIQTLAVSNPLASPLPVEYKLWLDVPGGSTLLLLRAGADDSIVLPAGASISDVFGGPILVTTVTSTSPPRGTYNINCRLENPVTGGDFVVDTTSFAVH